MTKLNRAQLAFATHSRQGKMFNNSLKHAISQSCSFAQSTWCMDGAYARQQWATVSENLPETCPVMPPPPVFEIYGKCNPGAFSKWFFDCIGRARRDVKYPTDLADLAGLCLRIRQLHRRNKPTWAMVVNT